MNKSNEAMPTQESATEPDLAARMLIGELTAGLVRAGDAFGAAAVAHERTMASWYRSDPKAWGRDRSVVVWPEACEATWGMRERARKDLEAAALALHAARGSSDG